MTSVTVIHVGELKEKYYAEACSEYEKRIGGFARLNNIEIKEAKLPNSPSKGEIDRALAEEGKKILSAIPDKSFAVALCVEGKRLSSEAFASVIDSAVGDVGKLTFIIGSSHGLADEVKSSCSLRLSVSDMTFPHRLMRVILLEQIYRAFAINGGLKYHK